MRERAPPSDGCGHIASLCPVLFIRPGFWTCTHVPCMFSDPGARSRATVSWVGRGSGHTGLSRGAAGPASPPSYLPFSSFFLSFSLSFTCQREKDREGGGERSPHGAWQRCRPFSASPPFRGLGPHTHGPGLVFKPSGPRFEPHSGPCWGFWLP